MRIATWNINGLRARLDFILIWLKARQPDVVGLQELKITDDEFPHEPFNALGYQVHTHGQKGWNGVAVVSRIPVEIVQRGLPGQDDFGARLITAETHDLSFTTVYCPNGKDVGHADYARKLAWYTSLTEYWKTIDSPAAVLCGDFNIAPTAMDSWRGEKAGDAIFHTREERASFARLTDLGLIDLYRAQFPDEQKFSWWDYRGGAFHRNHGLRIDFVLGTDAVLQRTVAVEIDRDFRKKKEGITASDHAPVFVDLD
tara:strand:+ start:265 stop:1032 length:768 start_codon:yes stop_codon:yes gene_type:complete